MKVDFSKIIRNLQGEPIKETEGGKDLTLGMVSATALLASFPDETGLEGSDKYKRFKLALLVAEGGVQEVEVEQAALLKKLLSKAYGPLVVGRSYEIIEESKVVAVKKAG